MSYTKFQIAVQYFPEQIDNSKVAVRHLVRWINKTSGLMPALLSTGYQRHQHHFTSRQVALIYEYLGEP